ncbi:hypothetical protein PLICRDRAFT_56695 [Plicaturopsis crispa FD-325 SS-3]|nr:hypothetical protein PLICRDRAFT_56695 [Plicaturopsis crispa FD-325 SS-3]
MPPVRSRKMRCAFRESPPPKARKPRAPMKVLTEEEKADAEIEKEVRKMGREMKKDWDAQLGKAWTPDSTFRFPIGTIAMYKSDAKSAYKLTEAEMLTLPHESIPLSPKTFYAQDAIVDLAQRKLDAGAMKIDFMMPSSLMNFTIRRFKKSDNDNRRRKANFSQISGFS